jgi:hypothetical protein
MSDVNKEQKGLTDQRPPCGYKGHTFLDVSTGILYTDDGHQWTASKPEGHEKSEDHAKAEREAHEKAQRENALKSQQHVEHATKG